MSEFREEVVEKSEPVFAAYLAIDWADQKHVWGLQVAGSGKPTYGEVDSRPEAVESWMQGLLTRFPGQSVAVIVEQSRGALVNMLGKYGQVVLYPVHPATVGRFRSALFPSGAKDDPKDAQLLLEILTLHRQHLRRLEPDTVETRKLCFWVEQRRELVGRKTAASNRLTDLLKQYYPQILRWFDNPCLPLVQDFLERWPTLQMVQKVRRQTLIDFFHQHNCRHQARIDQRLQEIREAVPATYDEAVLDTSIVLAHWTLKEIALLRGAIADLDRRIQQVSQAHPDFAIFDSLPGAGAVLVPRLMAALGTQRERFQNATQVQSSSGIAPVRVQSGTREWIHFRWACPKFLRQTFHEWAGHSIASSAWARAYYQQQCAKGNGHHAAVRSLAAKWIRILYRCCVNRTPYDEQIYLASLRKRNSPLVAALPVRT